MIAYVSHFQLQRCVLQSRHPKPYGAICHVIDMHAASLQMAGIFCASPKPQRLPLCEVHLALRSAASALLPHMTIFCPLQLKGEDLSHSQPLLWGYWTGNRTALQDSEAVLIQDHVQALSAGGLMLFGPTCIIGQLMGFLSIHNSCCNTCSCILLVNILLRR